MARQDFAQKRRSNSSASRAPARPKSPPPMVATKPSKKKSSAPSAKGSYKRPFLTLLALGGLGALLYVLLQAEHPDARIKQPAPKQPPASAPPAPTQVAPATTAPAPVATLPEPAEPEADPIPDVRENRFDFYDILPRSEVQAPQNVYRSTPRNANAPGAIQERFLLQAGSFRSESDAERMRAQLLLSGLPNVHTSRVDGENGIWYRVRTGPFNNRSELNSARNQLTSLGITPMPIPLN